MSRFLFTSLLAAMLLSPPAADAAQTDMSARRAKLVAGLEHEMTTQSQWLRIHAAEALLDNGEGSNNVAVLLRPDANKAAASYRIGVWRVLSRATNGDERKAYTKRIQEVLRDPQAADRVSAAESLGKLNAVTRADRDVVHEWLKTADDASAPFPRWLLVLSADPNEREHEEAGLAALLYSSDPIARLRTAYALGRLKPLSTNSMSRLRERLKVEPNDSVARVYIITALLLHEKDNAAVRELEKQLRPYFNGKANEQLEAGIVTGLRGQSEGSELLQPMLNSSEADGRIGAANGMLRLLK
jgi:hypothetical protein